MELEYNGVYISQMPTDRLTQSFHEIIVEYERRGLSALDFLPLLPPPDAALLEAVKRENHYRQEWLFVKAQIVSQKAQETCINSLREENAALRAVQAPRLNQEQVDAVRGAHAEFMDEGNRAAAYKLRAAFGLGEG